MSLLKISSIINFIIITILLYASFNYINDNAPKISYEEYVYNTLYIDNNFTDSEVDIILSATWEWSNKTQHRVNYKVVILNDYHQDLDLKNGILFNKLNQYNINIYDLDHQKDTITLGYYSNKKVIANINIVADRLNEDSYKDVVLHELGHSLGLHHNDDSSTLMYPYIQYPQNGLTKKDIDAYCDLHKCKSRNQ